MQRRQDRFPEEWSSVLGGQCRDTSMHWHRQVGNYCDIVNRFSAAVWKLSAKGKLFHSGLPHKAINSMELAMEALSVIQKRFYEDFSAHKDEGESNTRLALKELCRKVPICCTQHNEAHPMELSWRLCQSNPSRMFNFRRYQVRP